MMKQINLFRNCALCRFLKRMASVVAILSLLFVGHSTDLRAQLASCHSKSVGNIWYNGTMPLHFDQYFNQLTPENATKWASVQGSGPTAWNWGDATSMYNYCQSQGIPFKFHTLVWGNQYPSWLDDTSDKAAAVENWIRESARTFPNCDFVDVVNECLPNHAQPSWLGSIGGANNLYGTGWDWVVWSFEKARQYFPNSKLLINDYNILNNSWNNDLDVLCQIVNILKSRGLIDGIGLQSHGLESTTGADVTSRLNRITSLCPGIPIYISEFDLDIADDTQQRNKMAELFPIFWNNSAVQGITLWGYVQGHTWIPNSHLIRSDGSERPAMVWLKDYLSCDACTPTAINPYIQVNDGAWQQTSSVTVNSGDKVKFGPQPTSGGSWSWSGCGTSGTSREQTVYPTSSCTSTAIYTNSCGAQSTQNFNISIIGSTTELVNNGIYTIEFQTDTNKVIDLMNGSDANGTAIRPWTKNGATAQQWIAVSAGTNLWRFKSNASASGRVIDLNGGNTANGTSIQLWDNYNNDAQAWLVTSVGNGYYKIASKLNTSRGWDVPNCVMDGSQNLHLWDYYGTSCQLFKFNYVSLKSASEHNINTETGQPNFEIFPNPSTNGDFTIALSDLQTENSSVCVYSLQGKKVYENTNLCEGTNNISSGLTSGIYIIQVSLDNSVFYEKMTVQ
jgi:GH35 family endo-1,4-beta-xylanase